MKKMLKSIAKIQGNVLPNDVKLETDDDQVLFFDKNQENRV